MLHHLPSSDASVRRRRGYRPLDLEDEVEPVVSSSPDVLDDDLEDEVAERETVQKEGWHDLRWSFAVSGFVSVSHIATALRYVVLTSVKLASYFFPALFAIPLFGTYLAEEWLWYFSPSLSYVGQGKSLVDR